MIEIEKKRCLLVTKQPQKIWQLHKFGFTISILDILYLCGVGQVSKHHCVSFLPSNSKSVAPFDFIHSKVWDLLLNWFIDVESPKITQQVHCTKYVNLEFSKIVTDQGIIHELTCVNIPQQSGLQSERIIIFLRLLELYYLKCLFQMSIGRSCLNYHLPHKQATYACLTSLNRGKLDLRAIKCIFFGYPPNKKKYKCYHLQSRRFFVSMDPLTLRGEYSISRQIELFEKEVNVLEDYNDSKEVIDNMSIALRKAIQDNNWVQVMSEEMKALERNLT
ncbi:hypothetical protein CR513_26150, partial [Mucuna pruriens]